MTTVGIAHVRERTSSKWWWLLLVTGILWIAIGLFVLQAHYDSAALVGYLVAFWLIFAGVAEFVEVGVFEGWRWLHAIVGVLFLLGGFAALTSPFQTFMVLAALIAGILQILLGIWAMGYSGRSAALLLLWVGIGAIIRGIVEIIGSFQLKKEPDYIDDVVAVAA
jgi:uncharacterized membrane protein HdeD (DUF308 family)